MEHQYSYQAILAASERVNWRVEDLIGGDLRLDFGKPFLPETYARAQALGFLTPVEQRALNQIRGHGYLYIFGLVEEFILPFVLDHARPQLSGDDCRVRAFLAFAEEEAKHIHLFKQFRADFERGFGTACAVIGPPQEIARAVLKHHPLAVALVILHIEWMTQRHYVESIRGDEQLDPQFKSLLKHHWMEEAQHAKLDTLMVRSIARMCSEGEIEAAVEEYLEIGMMLDEGLKQQVEFDLDSLCRSIGRRLSDTDAGTFRIVQHQANRWTFLGTGMTHPNFLATLEELKPAARERVAAVAGVLLNRPVIPKTSEGERQ